MGALRGSLTFSRFFVLGDVPDDLAASAMKKIKANLLEPMSPDEDVNERHGWAAIDDPFDLELDHEKVFFNEYVTLALRVDRWVVPGPLLKAHLREAEEKLLEKKSLEKLGRKAKADLKLAVIKKLRRQLVPVTKTYDLVWNLQTHVALFFTHSRKVHELVMELFEKTFKLRLLVESPGTMADRRGLTPSEERVFASLEPTSLASASEARAAAAQEVAS
ncbi:MAG: recombination-associated protein RdgC [Polyangiaceae bacterium]|nr:recombination-associated protein RdgC [Polyangiaceae bacterium]